MKSSKVTQTELAARIGCSESMLSRFISGKTDKLGDESIIRIARVFHVSTDLFFPVMPHSIGHWPALCGDSCIRKTNIRKSPMLVNPIEKILLVAKKNDAKEP